MSTTEPAGEPSIEYGINEWLVDEMYEKFLLDRDSVERSWWPILEAYKPVAVTEEEHDEASPGTGDHRASRTTPTPVRSEPVSADPPETQSTSHARATDEVRDASTPLRGRARSLALDMDAGLSVPTATSVRTVPAKLMADNRTVINDHLRRTRGGKVSFTHLIAWAVVQSLKEFPSQNVHYQEIDGRPSIVTPSHINLGIAIDIPKPGGERDLVVPAIKQAEAMSFGEFVATHEELVSRARANQLTAGDFEHVTISLTNPGGTGVGARRPGRGGDRHGAPWPAQRAHQHRRDAIRTALPGVRG
ncbi:2-oxo acid dehydrogenase subunit E2 [Streptosporangium subroseum]|uniref:2-oxo acid dehydrogenase subunit E2 n=1 Tax=Streptosporangium subroseum TaxID=106412 RepID=UPI003F4E2DCE